MASGGIPLGQWSGSDATRELQQTIKLYQEQNSRQTDKLIFLTWVIAALTFVMLIGLGAQIYLAFYPPAVH